MAEFELSRLCTTHFPIWHWNFAKPDFEIAKPKPKRELTVNERKARRLKNCATRSRKNRGTISAQNSWLRQLKQTRNRAPRLETHSTGGAG